MTEPAADAPPAARPSASPPAGPGAPAADPGTAEQVAALSALYAADRQDGTAMVNTRLALLALQLTYLSLAAIALTGASDVPALVAAFSAFPLWFMHAYHLILVALSIARVNSCTELEDALYRHTGLPRTARDRIGARAGVPVTDITRQPLPLKIQAAVSYGGVGVVIFAFSGYGLVVAARDGGWGSPPVLAAGALYLLLGTTAVLSWRYVLGLTRPAGS
jgi:hypothetical protein